MTDLEFDLSMSPKVEYNVVFELYIGYVPFIYLFIYLYYYPCANLARCS